MEGKRMEGKILSLEVANESDLQRLVSHTTLAQLMIPAVGLEFESDRTSNMEMTLETLLMLAVQDMKENAQQIVNVEGTQEETSSKLVEFFAAVEELGVKFPWKFCIKCPMGLSTIEPRENDTNLTCFEYEIMETDPMFERVAAAYAERAFEAADELELAGEDDGEE